MSRPSLAANLLVYADGLDGPEKAAAVAPVLEAAIHAGGVVPAQALGEYYNVLVRKRGLRSDEALRRVARWTGLYDVHAAEVATFERALELASAHRLQVWDAVILATSAQAGCSMLLTEDLQQGFSWSGVTVVNPFAHRPHELLAELLSLRRQ